MDDFDYHEKLSFGKVGENNLDIKSPNNYALFHQTFNSKFLLDSGKILVGVNYDVLKGYLEGASVGKSNREFYLYNGISSAVRGDFYPGVEFLSLDEGELEKLLNDTRLKRRFEKTINTIKQLGN